MRSQKSEVRSQKRVQAFELLAILLLLVTGFRATAQEKPVRQASDAEAAAGADVRAYETPRQIMTYGGGGGSPTGGMTQAQAQLSYASGSNTFKGTFQGLGAGLTNLANANLVVASTNIVITYSTNASTGQITATASVADPLGLTTLNVTNMNLPTLAPAAAHTNVVFIDSSGHLITNDLATFVASLGGGTLTQLSGTNSIIFLTNTINHQAWTVDTNGIAHLQTNGVDVITLSTNGLTVNTGSSNYFGGINYMQSNAAPFTVATPAGLNSILMNKGWTNNFGRQADLVVEYFLFSNSSTERGTVGLTNTVTGESWTNLVTCFTGPQSNVVSVVYPSISPGDYGSISNYSSGALGSASITHAVWKLK